LKVQTGRYAQAAAGIHAASARAFPLRRYTSSIRPERVTVRVARPAKQAVRKKDLVRATMLAIHETGMAEPTMAQISSRAGLSSGSIISHYFASKDELMEETYRELATVFAGEVASRVRAVRTPMEKVEAIVAAVFAPSQTSPEAVSVWLWYWSRAAISSGYAEIERETYNSVRTQLEAALSGLVPKSSIRDVAEGLLALMYGLWLRFALDPTGLDAARAMSITMDSVHARLAVGNAAASSLSKRVARAARGKVASKARELAEKRRH
jgi:TetR/AcrR family transcriptional repressor of bet genes